MTIKKYRKGNTGFTLLEMLVVLAIIGSVSVVMVRQHQRDAEAAVIRATADAMADEMLDLARLAQKKELKKQDGTAYKNDMYTTANNSSARSKRSNNYNIFDPIPGSQNLYKWDDQTNGRNLFTEKKCKINGQPGSNSGYDNLNEEYLSCQLSKLADNDFKLRHVGVVGTNDNIQRIDFYWEFMPLKATGQEYAKLLNYIDDIFKSFGKRDAAEPKIYLIKNTNNGSQSPWSFELKDPNQAGQNLQDNAIPVGVPTSGISAMDKLLSLNTTGTTKYGIRVSVDIWSGEYLKADGSVRAEKLCWDASSGTGGVCLTSYRASRQSKLEIGSDGGKETTSLCWNSGSGRPILCLKNEGYERKRYLELENIDNGQESVGTLVAELVNKVTINGQVKYSTVPVTDYVVFDNNQPVRLPILTCPINPGNGQVLQNKIAISLASFAADVDKGTNKVNFTTIDRGTSLNGRNQLHRTAGVFVSANIESNNWKIEANNVSHRVTDGNQTGINSDNAKNPDSVALIVQRWCSN